MRSTLLAPLLTLFLITALGCASSASRPSAIGVSIDAAVRTHLGTDFNGVVLVKSGQTPRPIVQVYGLANVEKATPASAHTRYQIGSISKWITSVAVLRLVERGKLSLDVPIQTYLPELRAETASRVTLRHLLSNTSGIPNGVMQEFKKDKTIATLPLTSFEAAMRFGNGTPAFAPGTSFDYSLTNWVIVAAIIERVSGQTFMRVIEEQVFAPARLHDMGFASASFLEHSDSATAYGATLPRQLKMSPVPAFAAASGSMFSTAADLARAADAVYDGSLLSRASLEELSHVNVPDEHYALGGRVRTLHLGGRDRQVAWESGANGGYKTLLAHVAGEEKSVVILNNTDVQQSAQASVAEEILRALY